MSPSLQSKCEYTRRALFNLCLTYVCAYEDKKSNVYVIKGSTFVHKRLTTGDAWITSKIVRWRDMFSRI